MTEKRFQWCERTDIEYVDEFVVDTSTNKELDEEDMCDLLNELSDENEHLIKKRGELETKNVILKGENERMTNKLNELAFEFLKHNMISMEKAVEISEMSYHDFLKYRKNKGNPMELQL